MSFFLGEISASGDGVVVGELVVAVNVVPIGSSYTLQMALACSSRSCELAASALRFCQKHTCGTGKFASESGTAIQLQEVSECSRVQVCCLTLLSRAPNLRDPRRPPSLSWLKARFD